jgi:hypothetical protein
LSLHDIRTAVAVLAAAVATLGAACLAAAPARAGDYPPYPSRLTVKSELRFKANLVRDNLARSPQLVFFGGSRSERFDPAFARKKTGLRAVNISVSCARPEDAWGMLNWFYARWPDAKIRWVWGMQSGMLRDLRRLDPALVQDPRFYRHFPDDLLAAQRALLPKSVDRMPRHYGFLRNKYSDLGLLRRNVYDRRLAKGYTLDMALVKYIARVLHDPSHTAMPETLARTYFERTIRLLNEHGTTPIMVIMPIQPRVLRVMRRHHLGGERQQLRDYLAELSQTVQIKVLDLTDIRSFKGRADWFYDGVHIRQGNADRVILAIRRQAGKYLR